MNEAAAELFVPIVGILVLFGLPIGGWIAIRILQYRERMAMIERGMIPPPLGRHGRRPVEGWHDVSEAQDGLRKGVLNAMIGLALLIGLSFIGYHADGPFGYPTIRPGPWLLGGLIPMFVGLAQIVNALMSGAQFPGRGSAAPPPQPHAARPAAPFGGAQPQPPWPAREELGRPPQPPEAR